MPGRMLGLWRSECGGAMIIALLVLLVLSVLGTVFVFAMQTEARTSLRYGDKNEAYYLARSGAETAYEMLLLEDSEGDLAEFLSQPRHLKGALSVDGLSLNSGSGTIGSEQILVNITIVEDANSAVEEINIIADGQAGELTARVILNLYRPEFVFNYPLLYSGEVEFPPSAVLDTYPYHRHILSWTSGTSGRIDPQGEGEGVWPDPVVFGGPGSSARINPGNVSYLEAEAMYFVEQFDVMQNATLHLKADPILIDSNFDIRGGGKLCLHASGDGTRFRFNNGLIYDGEPILDNNTYYIPAGEKICLPCGVGGGPALDQWPLKWEWDGVFGG